ncbi:conjugal transfer protein TrbO [Escherichia coli]|nr:conjugal transfer protein TrbO [Escherichia coli]
MGIRNLTQRYMNGARAYAAWAASQAKAPFDLLVLGIGPVIVFGLVAHTLLAFLPTWAMYAAGALLGLAALPLALHVLREYALRYGRK